MGALRDLFDGLTIGTVITTVVDVSLVYYLIYRLLLTIRGTRAVYAKAWAAPMHYADAAAGLEARKRLWDWTVRERTMALGDHAVFLHCLPVRRNVVVADEVLDGPRCRVYREAGNRLITAQAVLATLLGGR